LLSINISPYKKVAPLHLVNVTINETVSGKSQIEQRDRKGLAMALGPAALSAGVTSHLLFRGGSGANRYDYDKVKVLPSSGSAFEHSANSGKMVAERLPLGQWTGISGAASTGLGARTSLGISLLLVSIMFALVIGGESSRIQHLPSRHRLPPVVDALAP
jgi:hypothetical protein